MTALVPAARWYDWHTFLEDNQRKMPYHFVSPDGTTFIPAPANLLTNGGRAPGFPPIDLLRTYGLTAGDPTHPVYIADEHMHRTWSFQVGADGSLNSPKLFAEKGEAGSIVDSQGNVYVISGDIFVYDPAGKLIDTIAVPERPLSLVFAGPDRKTLYIAARSSLYSLRMSVSGVEASATPAAP